MDAINIGLIAEKRLSVHHAVLYLIALLFCTYFRITLLVIYPLLVVFLFYLFSWKLDRNALYLLGFTFLFWLLSFRDGIYLKYNLVSLYFYIPFILLLCATPSKINPERNFLKMLMYPLTFVAIINNFFGLAQYIRIPKDDSFEGLYGTFTVSQNGLSLINAILFFYHLCMYQKNKKSLVSYAPNLTHYHRLVERFGLIEDIRFCLTNDIANVLPVYKDGMLIKG